MFLRQPHWVGLTRPVESRDADTNIGERSETGAREVTKRGMFQERGGDAVQTREGQVVSKDAVFYTKDTDGEVNDIIQPKSLQTTERFIVTDVERKYRVNGRFSHLECTLTLEDKLEEGGES